MPLKLVAEFRTSDSQSNLGNKLSLQSFFFSHTRECLVWRKIINKKKKNKKLFLSFPMREYIDGWESRKGWWSDGWVFNWRRTLGSMTWRKFYFKKWRCESTKMSLVWLCYGWWWLEWGPRLSPEAESGKWGLC